MPKQKAGTLDIKKLAARVEIPIDCVQMIMTDEWKKVRETIIT